MATNEEEGRALVEAVRDTARAHKLTWEALVPDPYRIMSEHEAAEDAAYTVMAEAKRHLRDHICETYGISIRELASLAIP